MLVSEQEEWPSWLVPMSAMDEDEDEDFEDEDFDDEDFDDEDSDEDFDEDDLARLRGEIPMASKKSKSKRKR